MKQMIYRNFIDDWNITIFVHIESCADEPQSERGKTAFRSINTWEINFSKNKYSARSVGQCANGADPHFPWLGKANSVGKN